eukprot:UN34642
MFFCFCRVGINLAALLIVDNDERLEKYPLGWALFIAFFYQGFWHSFEWALLSLLYQRNGGMKALWCALYVGSCAHIVYTGLWSWYLTTDVAHNDYIVLIFFGLHMFSVTIWFLLLTGPDIINICNYIAQVCNFMVSHTKDKRRSGSLKRET